LLIELKAVPRLSFTGNGSPWSTSYTGKALAPTVSNTTEQTRIKHAILREHGC
jgi:hypothetical protein